MTEPDLYKLPGGLPVPEDDGACDHLPGLRLPPLELPSTLSGSPVDLSALSGRTVVYCYPLTGPPHGGLPEGWDAIPGARGCTPQSCAFRDYHGKLRGLGVRVFGLSTQSTAYQREAAQRLELPFELLSDEKLQFVETLQLPTFEADSMLLVRRLTLVIEDGRIEKVFYPVFPPDRNAAEVVGWLSGESWKG